MVYVSPRFLILAIQSPFLNYVALSRKPFQRESLRLVHALDMGQLAGDAAGDVEGAGELLAAHADEALTGQDTQKLGGGTAR